MGFANVCAVNIAGESSRLKTVGLEGQVLVDFSATVFKIRNV
jgi:hypothetical protein